MQEPRVIMTAKDIKPLSPSEHQLLERIREKHYTKSTSPTTTLEHVKKIDGELETLVQEVIAPYRGQLRVFPKEHPYTHKRMSSLIQRLRNNNTGQAEFRSTIEWVYRLLFDDAYCFGQTDSFVQTRVTVPTNQYSAQLVPTLPENPTLVVLLRGALYPSVVLGTEFAHTTGKTPDYALFRIERGHQDKGNLEFTLKYAHYNPTNLHQKDLVIADPMLATAGSFIAIYRLLTQDKIEPRSIKFFGTIGAIEGAIQAIRHVPNLEIHLAWLDPVLNEKGYILPGLGDAGDLLNGKLESIDALFASYGREFCTIHRKQIETVYKSIKKEPQKALFESSL